MAGPLPVCFHLWEQEMQLLKSLGPKRIFMSTNGLVPIATFNFVIRNTKCWRLEEVEMMELLACPWRKTFSTAQVGRVLRSTMPR